MPSGSPGSLPLQCYRGHQGRIRFILCEPALGRHAGQIAALKISPVMQELSFMLARRTDPEERKCQRSRLSSVLTLNCRSNPPFHYKLPVSGVKSPKWLRQWRGRAMGVFGQ